MSQSALFETSDNEASSKHKNRPLADRLRPQSIQDVAGQDHLTGEDGRLTKILNSGHIPSLIFWGPPGTGKTTLARLLASQTSYQFEQISAIHTGVKDLRQVFDSAKIRRKQSGLATLLFVDEIHRFNKSQQDSFLPVMEDGTITLIGATTENPSFALNAALLSRAQVLVLNRLGKMALLGLLQRAEDYYDVNLPLTDDAKDILIALADGDGRYFLSMVEQIMMIDHHDDPITEEHLMATLQRRAPLYDKADDAHYNLISALHKSVRGSDPDAALYWFARMLDGGEDPIFLARRLIRMASEDIGLADPQAITQALSAWEVYERLGSPEGELALAQAIVYMATAPKSNAVYKAMKEAQKAAKDTGSLTPPKHILNAPISLMKYEGYGAGYHYDHDTPEGFSGQSYFPDEMARQQFYAPPERGFEREINKRLAYWKKLREQKSLAQE